MPAAPLFRLCAVLAGNPPGADHTKNCTQLFQIMDKRFTETLTAEDFLKGTDTRLIAHACGVEVAVEVMRHLAGLKVHIFQLPVHGAARRWIRENRHEYSPEELALQTGCSRAFVGAEIRALINLGKRGVSTASVKAPDKPSRLSFMQTINPNDFPDNSDMRFVVELLGVNHSVALMQHFGGCTLYIPRLALKAAAERYVYRNRRKFTPKELSEHTGFSVPIIESFIRKKETKQNAV